jgi:hypothetical protein
VINQERNKGNPEEAPKPGSGLAGVAKFALAGILIYYLVRRGDIRLGELGAALSAHWMLGLLATLVMVFSYMGQGYRWDVILRDRRIPTPYWQALRYLMIGKFFNLAVPGYFSEDIVRGLYLIRRNTAPRPRVLMTLMADRLVGTMSLFLIGAAGLIVRSVTTKGVTDARLVSLRSLTLLACVSFVGGILIVRRFPAPPSPFRAIAGKLRLLKVLEAAWAELHYYCCSPKLQLKLLGVSLVNHGLMVSSFVIFGYALGMRVALADYCIFVPLGILVTMIPVAPIGLGVGHVAFLTLFRISGSPAGANLFSLYTAVCIVLNLVGGLFYVGLGRPREAPPMAATESAG